MRQEIKVLHLEDLTGHNHDSVMIFDIMMPVEIKIDFTPNHTSARDKIVWTLSRDMLVDAVMHRKPSGIGDVKMRAQVTEVGTLLVLSMTGWDDSMTRQEGTMELAVNLSVVENFLRKTLAIRPQHADDLIIGKQIDAGLARLLA